MAIINPVQLFELAERLTRDSGGQQVYLRRAVSDAYYGLSHTVTMAIGDYLVGRIRRSSLEWSLAARSVDHRHLRQVCEGLERPAPPANIRSMAPSASGFSLELRTFARTIVELQQKRHDADYNPLVSFKVSDVKSVVAAARSASSRFETIGDSELRVFVCLIAFKAR